MPDVPEEDDDFVDGCEVDFEAEAIPSGEEGLWLLFPDGVPDEDLARQWNELALARAEGKLGMI